MQNAISGLHTQEISDDELDGVSGGLGGLSLGDTVQGVVSTVNDVATVTGPLVSTSSVITAPVGLV
ncbi:type A2 lantipeptide [Streptomyces fuscigenes]|uniref:type A2 lantipeptide n=1 Tax=Streptomyces fuscigenes TaxID=1528880 RepID=UPI001F38589F|nr:type A2 lantipeptide [Streptomyces fuscigenes]MCF3960869.1 type A2 lantipeptide [Streptomyces fuscigenes]